MRYSKKIIRHLDHLKVLEIGVTFGFLAFSIFVCWVGCRNPADL